MLSYKIFISLLFLFYYSWGCPEFPLSLQLITYRTVLTYWHFCLLLLLGKTSPWDVLQRRMKALASRESGSSGVGSVWMRGGLSYSALSHSYSIDLTDNACHSLWRGKYHSGHCRWPEERKMLCTSAFSAYESITETATGLQAKDLNLWHDCFEALSRSWSMSLSLWRKE